MKTRTIRTGAALGLTCAALSAQLFAAAPTPPAARYDSATISGLPARNIGSATMSGRISTIAARQDGGKTTVFVGAASGGVWKSTDGGTTFKPVFDDMPVQSIGDITIDPSNPRNVWVGTGEAWTRNSVSVGNGIYKSSDGGESFSHVGLPDSERIARILVHPKNSDTVYACVPGKLWSDSADRGLYKTTDGGRNWALVLKGANLSTGCSNLTMDPKNPDKLFVGMWDFRRKGWTFRSGGEGPEAKSGSGLFVTTDGGSHFTQLSADNNKGLPEAPYGRIGVEIAPSDPNIVYAAVEARDSALYVSADGGLTWEARDKSQSMVWRPFYFAHLIVDPSNAMRVFKTNLNLIVSDDGGKSFQGAGGGAHGDWHALWINPENPKHLIGGDDGGLWISYDGGVRWWKGNNLPISQFYHVSVDQEDPYNVYGGLQDNSSWTGPSAKPGGIGPDDWDNRYGGDGFWTFADPSDQDYLYAEYQGGNISRINRHTHESRSIQPTAGAGEKLRWNWNTPIHLSPNEKGTLYIGAQFLFRSRDQGSSWERISPDLSTNDKTRQQQELSGGITVDNSSAEMHTTIYSISESPKDPGTIWVGTDDGNVQLTRDGGGQWSNVVGNIKGLPKGSWVSWVEASPHAAGTAFATFDRHMEGDIGTYLYRTTDYGKTWTALITPATPGVSGYAHVVRQDPVTPGLLYVGTEFGLWISIDGGARWAQYTGSNFPAVAVRDLVVHPREGDLVLATHGRGIWIIDDISALRQLNDEVLASDATFIKARPQKQNIMGGGGWGDGDAVFIGANPPEGAVITYYQRTRHLFGKLKLEVLDADGVVVKSLPASKRRGLNRVLWDMKVDPPRVPKAAQLAFAGTQGPRVLPGTYTVRISKGEHSYETTLDVVLDPRAKFNLEDRKAQYAAAMRVHALFGRMSDLASAILSLRDGADQRAAALPEKDKLRAELAKTSAEADALRKQIVATKEGGAITGEERLREFTDTLYGAIVFYEGRPGDYQLKRIEVLEQELAKISAEFDSLKNKALPKLNAALDDRALSPIAVIAAPERSGGAPLEYLARMFGWRETAARGGSIKALHSKRGSY